MFTAHLWTPVELQTEILPYLAVVNAPLRNPGLCTVYTSVCVSQLVHVCDMHVVHVCDMHALYT